MKRLAIRLKGILDSYHDASISMSDKELQPHLNAIQTELESQKWVRVSELMSQVNSLSDEELTELLNRVWHVKCARTEVQIMSLYIAG